MVLIAMKRNFSYLAMATVAAVLAVFGGMPVQAQPGSNGPRMDQSPQWGRGFDRLQDRLELTDEQAVRVRGILEAHRAEGRAMMRARRDTLMGERRTMMTAHREELTAKLSEVLTPEQLESFEQAFQLRGTVPDPRMRRPAGGRGAVRGMGYSRMLDRLDLNESQVDQLRALRQEHRAEALAWRSDNPDATPEQIRAFRRSHWQEMRADLESVLTDDQLNEYQEMLGSRVENWNGRRDKAAGRRFDSRWPRRR